MRVTINSIHDHGSVVVMTGVNEDGTLARIPWDENQFYNWVRDHQDVALPFDAYFDDDGEEPVFWAEVEE
jgi:hypothetical protein